MPPHRRLFAQNGYSVALIARGGDSINKLTEEIKAAGGQVKSLLYPLLP